MVNTFVLFPSISASARHLDLVRLRKQCVEAYQIRRILHDLHLICQTFTWPACPIIKVQPQPSVENLVQEALSWQQVIKWVEDTRKWYLKQDYRLVCQNGEWKYCLSKQLMKDITKLTTDSYYMPPASAKFTDHGDTIQFTINKQIYNIPRSNVILPTDTSVTLGFASHPAVKMWTGYESALEYYINAHCAEYNRRMDNGKSIKIPTYDIPTSVSYPWWMNVSHVIHSHRGALMRKETLNHEPAHYINFLSEYQNYPFGYLWPPSLSVDELQQMCTENSPRLQWHAKINDTPSRQLGWKLTITKTGAQRFYYDGKPVAKDKVDSNIQEQLMAEWTAQQQTKTGWHAKLSVSGQRMYYYDGKRVAKDKVPSDEQIRLNAMLDKTITNSSTSDSSTSNSSTNNSSNVVNSFPQAASSNSNNSFPQAASSNSNNSFPQAASSNSNNSFHHAASRNSSNISNQSLHVDTTSYTASSNSSDTFAMNNRLGTSFNN